MTDCILRMQGILVVCETAATAKTRETRHGKMYTLAYYYRYVPAGEGHDRSPRAEKEMREECEYIVNQDGRR